MSREELLQSFRKHNKVHAELYEFARIPEALDRGLPFFTNYLKDYLRKNGVLEADLPNVFNELTKPKNPSIFLEEKSAFQKIVSSYGNVVNDLSESQRTSMFLPPDLLRDLKGHMKQYKWLAYHGYRSPDLPSIQPYVNRFFTEAEQMKLNLLSSTIVSSPTGYNLLNPENIQRPQIISSLLKNSTYELIDEKHKVLFDAYPEISRAKVVRRFAQLRNFYYYDKLLEACADKLDIPEIDVRCCLSEELEKALETGSFDSTKRNRVKNKFVILYTGEGKHVLGSEESKALLKNVTLKEDIDFQHSTIYPGFAKGIARHVIDQNSEFKTGDIAICPSADPDLVTSFLQTASAVICADPGVTGHGALVLRELQIPSMAMPNALTEIPDGSYIDVNTTEGKFEIIEHFQQVPESELVFLKELWQNPEVVGNKASNLKRATLHHQVPEYMPLDYEKFKTWLRENPERLEGELKKLLPPLLKGRGNNDEGIPLFLLRSSALDEDSKETSMAGRYTSIVVNSIDDLMDAARRFVESNDIKGYKGSIILQQFIPALACGVALCGASHGNGSENKITIEISHGHRNTVTDGGDDKMERIECDLNTTLFKALRNGGATQATISVFSTDKLIRWVQSVIEKYGDAKDIEFGVDSKGEFLLYQFRPIAKTPNTYILLRENSKPHPPTIQNATPSFPA